MFRNSRFPHRSPASKSGRGLAGSVEKASLVGMGFAEEARLREGKVLTPDEIEVL